MRKLLVYIFCGIVMFAAQVVSAQTSQTDYFYERLLKNGYDTVNVENSGLRRFLDDSSYDMPENISNYSYSVVRKYSKGIPSKPAGIVLRWDSITPVEKIDKVVVTLVESPTELKGKEIEKKLNGRDVKLYYPNVASRDYLLCNMIPQRYCYYKVEELLKDGVKGTVKTGKFFTDGQIRMLRVDGMSNVRDFGGWETSFDRTVVYGRIYRGNRPDGITATGRNDFVVNEHITADLDLRGNDLGQSPLGPRNEVEYYCTDNYRYKLGLTTHTDVLAKNLNTIASVLLRGGNVFLHCYHGVNRAGTLSFLLEGILGFSEADLTREYELSSFAYGTSRNKTYGDMLAVIKSYGEPGDDLAQCFYNYARRIGVSESTLDNIRCVMLKMTQRDSRIMKAHKR